MARPIDPGARVGIESGDFHANLMKVKSRQFFSTASSRYPSGPRQMHSGIPHGDSDGKKKNGLLTMRTDFTQNEPHVQRQRAGNLKNFVTGGRSHRQQIVYDNCEGISIDKNSEIIGDVKDFCGKPLSGEKRNGEKAFVGRGRNLEGAEIGRNRRDIVLRKDSEEGSLQGKGTVGINSFGGNVCQNSNTDKQTQGNSNIQRVTVNGAVKSQTDQVCSSRNQQKEGCIARSENLDRTGPKFKPTNITIKSKSYNDGKNDATLEGKQNNEGKSRIVIRSFDESQIVRDQDKVDVPKLDLGSNTEGEKAGVNNRYARTSLRRVQLQSSTDNKSCPDFRMMNREASSSGDKPAIAKRSEGGKVNVSERIIAVQKHSVEILHARQGSDPTSLYSARNLSSVSQDLMRSKEELINRSRECGRMLEQYKQRGLELREQMAERRYEAPSKPAEQKISPRDVRTDAITAQNNCDEEIERSYNQRKPYLEKVANSLDDVGRQSPKYGKRKTSYMDSWLQSQHSRISTLVSAIKEEDSDSNAIIPENTRERTKSVPQNTTFGVASKEVDDFVRESDIQPVHRRTQSGDDILGVSRNANIPRYSESSRQTPRESPRNRSRAESPKQNDGYSPDDLRQRSWSIQRESYSRLSRAGSVGKTSARSSSNTSPTGHIAGHSAGHSAGNGGFRPISVSSPRSQSETASPRLQHSFDSSKSVSLGNSPRLRKETTFDSDIVTQVVTEAEPALTSPRPVVSRRSSSGSEYFSKFGSLPRSGSPRKVSSPGNHFFGEQENNRFGSLPRSPPGTTVSSSYEQGDIRFNSLPRKSSNQFSPTPASPTQSQFSPTNSLSRRKELYGEHVAKQGAPSQPLPQETEADPDTSFRSANDDKFDWPAPPDLDSFPPAESEHNLSWPNASGSSPPFTNGRGHQEGGKYFPVAVVKPLQHEKSRSLDDNEPGGDFKSGFKVDLPKQAENLGPAVFGDSGGHEIENQTINCYNVRMSQSSLNAETREKSQDSSSNNSLEFREKGVDVGGCDKFEHSRDASDAENAPGISSLITQDFQWYKPMGQSSQVSSLDRDDPTRDSTHERLGRFKRGSKLLSSKYQSFSKSLENLSKVGKDFIKSKKKASDGKDEKGDGKKSAKKKEHRKSVVLGDVQLNDEFAMKMEKRSRASLDMSEAETNTRQESVNHSFDFSQSKTTLSTKVSSSSLNRSLNSSNNSSLNEEANASNRRRMPERKGNGNESDVIGRPGHVSQPFMRGGRVETEFGVRDSIRRREVKSEYFGNFEEPKANFSRPKSEYFDHQERDLNDVNSGFIDDEEEEKEMVQIVRKISGLRSSQVKIKKDTHSKAPIANSSRDIESSENIPKRRSDEGVSSRLIPPQKEEERNLADENKRVEPDSNFEAPMEQQKQQQLESLQNQIEEPVAKEQASNPDPMKRISTSLSRVMTDLRELREQDLTLATQLITLGKSIKHFKQQKKEMDDFYAQLDDGESSEESDSDSDEEETASYTESRMTTDF